MNVLMFANYRSCGTLVGPGVAFTEPSRPKAQTTNIFKAVVGTDQAHFSAKIFLLLLTDLQHRVFGSFYQPALGLDIRGYGWS
jgi:hypothetical protein